MGQRYRIRIKRIYEPRAPGDGLRVLVDRIWPRGIKKSDAGVDLWLREVAPSSALRKWFAHDPAKWPAFRERYRQELRDDREAFMRLADQASRQDITLLFAARDRRHNQAVVLRDLLHRGGGAALEHSGPVSPVCYAGDQAVDD